MNRNLLIGKENPYPITSYPELSHDHTQCLSSENYFGVL